MAELREIGYNSLMFNLAPYPQLTDSVSVNSIPFTFLDISTVVNRFYEIVAKDPVLSAPFSSVEDWPHHIDRLTHFWWIRFGGAPYRPDTYNPVAKHFEAGFNQMFLSRWLSLFHEVLEASLPPEQSALWKSVSERMGYALTMKDEAYRRSMGSESR